MTTPANPPRFAGHHTEPAQMGDADILSHVIADAFFSLAVSQWLVPDPEARRAIFPSYFRLLFEHAINTGLVETTPDRAAAALWVPVGTAAPRPSESYSLRLAEVAGMWFRRFAAFDAILDRYHPTGVAHEHLAILAVRPDKQGQGIGTALLRARHAVLDDRLTPGYLEASDERTRDIYLAHGYADLGPIELASGTRMHSMWREPHAGCRRRM